MRAMDNKSFVASGAMKYFNKSKRALQNLKNGESFTPRQKKAETLASHGLKGFMTGELTKGSRSRLQYAQVTMQKFFSSSPVASLSAFEAHVEKPSVPMINFSQEKEERPKKTQRIFSRFGFNKSPNSGACTP